ncbi:SAM-dependent methyltransferase [Fodinicola acaciae]|uniref:SAM-dependent methyltransferase n=1 Tax=Fodinicola acaciae TaxID=2681555 RepID=UPI0013D87D21|nr:SAM-dependent methyltransferase [Fodinicola acaciae]
MANPAAGTALGPMSIVAMDQYEEHPLIDDPLAGRFLPSGTRTMVAATKWSPLRHLMVNATERQIPGLWGSMLCRKRYVDDRVREAVSAGAGQVVILGAGWDTRAYRMGLGVRVFEVDLPENIDRKRAALERIYGRVPDEVTLVPLDFQTQSLPDVLTLSGKTFFVWEAVTQYLSEEAVRAVFRYLSTAEPGSGLVFTYVREDFIAGTAMYGAEAAYKRFVASRPPLWTFGMDPEKVAGFLAEYGWRLTEDVGPAEFTERYVRPAGRQLAVTEIERSVSAVRAEEAADLGN